MFCHVNLYQVIYSLLLLLFYTYCNLKQTSIRSASAFMGSLLCACMTRIAEVAKLFADISFTSPEIQHRSLIFLTRAEQSDDMMSVSR